MIVDTCEWNNPGQNPYNGSVIEAIQSYSDISQESKKILIEAVKANKYERVLISKTGIFSLSENQYAPEITEMHFGNGHRCNKVDISKWEPYHLETARVYESPEASISIPDVCNNVSRLKRTTPYIGPRDPVKAPERPIQKVPEPWSFPMVLAAAAYFTYRYKNV